MIGSVYRIIHLHSNICYVGSTLDSVRNRWQGHKYKYKAYLKNDTDKHAISIYPYFDRYGIDSFKCILVKEYEVEDRNHLFAYEQLWINKFNPINKLNAFNPLLRVNLYRNAYRELNKDKIKQYRKKHYEANRDKLLQAKKEYDEVNQDKIKEYREANKDKAKQYHKEYKEANKDKLKQARKEYYQANKDKIKQYRDANKDKAKQYRERRKQLKEQLEYKV